SPTVTWTPSSSASPASRRWRGSPTTPGSAGSSRAAAAAGDSAGGSAPERRAAHDLTYAEALDWLYAQTRAGGRCHPGRAARLLGELSLEPPPHLVRVVGTNGKGTVSHLIATGLSAAGRRTGLFLSPHVESFDERVSVDGARVTPAEIAAFVARARTALDRYAPDGDARPAFFELTLALALDAFARRGADWAVLEAGVGGASDATTAAAPPDRVRLVVLPNVDLDHVEPIGPGPPDIARENRAA